MFGFEIKPRPIVEWLLWLLWLFVEVFVLQNAIASGTELQSTAAIIFWVIFVVLLVAGVVVWIIRKPKS
jgi:hypothetical protein